MRTCLVIVGSVLALVVVLVVAFGALIWWQWEHDVPSKSSVEARITEHVQPGDSVEEIHAFLRSGDARELGIEDPEDRLEVAADNSQLLDRGIPPNTPVYSTILRGGSRGYTIHFILTKELTFQRLIVLEYSILP
jgi:hypothetical protein